MKSRSQPAGSVSTFLRARSAWGWRETVFWLSAPAAYILFDGSFGLPNDHQLISEIAITALFALSLDLILGYAGIVSLGHGAFFGLGAYTAGLAASWGAGSFPISDPIFGLVFAGLVAALVGALASLLLLRGSDLNRLMVTLGVALVVEELCNQARWLTGGSDGLQGVEPAPILGRFDFDLSGNVAAVYSLVVLFLCFLFARRLVRSSFGASLLAIKENPLRARSVGAPVELRLVCVYAVGAGLAGVAGGLLAQTTQSASLDMAAFHRSGDVLVILVFGGAGRLYGALVGAAVFSVAQNWLSDITPEYWLFWLGLLLVALVLFAKGGILGLVDRLSPGRSQGKRAERGGA